jgi:hypothetical protein
VYSQSKSRSSRHKNRQRHSAAASGGDVEQPQDGGRGGGGHHSSSAETTEVITMSPYQPPKVLKETVFSSEIHSIEYNSPALATTSAAASIASSSNSSNDSPKMTSKKPPKSKKSTVASKNIIKNNEVIVFDDINVTYDLIEGEFPPPNLSGLVVRDSNDLLTSDHDLPKGGGRHHHHHHHHHHHGGHHDDLDSLVLGEEACEAPESVSDSVIMTSEVDRRSEASSGGSKVIGDLAIAEYEGSPRRYRPRPQAESGSDSSEIAASASASAASKQPPQQQQHQQKRPPLRLPGFPQRVLPAAPSAENTESVLIIETKKVTSEETLLKFEEQQPLKMQPASTAASEQVDFDNKMRYEFSETRKVLDEFFHKDELQVQQQQQQQQDFSELNYVLRKNQNDYVGLRLAASEDLVASSDISPEAALVQAVITNAENNISVGGLSVEPDLLFTSPSNPQPPNSLEVASMTSKGPQLGVSPLDQLPTTVGFQVLLNLKQNAKQFYILNSN